MAADYRQHAPVVVGSILFVFGVRLSTWLCLLAFVLLAAWRSERAPLVAAVAWLAGYEAAYQAAAMLLHTPSPVPVVGPISVSLVVGAPLVLAAMTALGARPNPILLSLALAVFAAWLASGFHVNTDPAAINPLGEALNEGSKTLWALAYLWPLLRLREEFPRVRRAPRRVGRRRARVGRRRIRPRSAGS